MLQLQMLLGHQVIEVAQRNGRCWCCRVRRCRALEWRRIVLLQNICAVVVVVVVDGDTDGGSVVAIVVDIICVDGVLGAPASMSVPVGDLVFFAAISATACTFASTTKT